MADLERILIVGGGIAGLTLATALYRQGFATELVERSPSWPAVGAGIALPGNGVRVLRALGLADVVERDAARLTRWAFYDQRGDRLCETDLEAFWGEVGPCLGVTRVKLQAALLRGAAAARLILGRGVTSLVPGPRRVSIHFDDGADGDYDLVVGADGIYSTTRRLTVDPSPPRYAGQMAWRSVVPTRPPGVTHQMVFLGEGCFFGLVPMGDGHTYGFGAIASDRFDDPLPGRLERFRRRFAAFGGPVPAYLAALARDEQLHVGPIEWVETVAWRRGRVVLIGDAAHAGPPHMAEGGCMAMEDALVLAEELRAADTVEGALDRYEARRRPRIDWVREQSRAAAHAFVLPPEVRDAALRQRGDEMLRDRYRPLLAMA